MCERLACVGGIFNNICEVLHIRLVIDVFSDTF